MDAPKKIAISTESKELYDALMSLKIEGITLESYEPLRKSFGAPEDYFEMVATVISGVAANFFKDLLKDILKKDTSKVTKIEDKQVPQNITQINIFIDSTINEIKQEINNAPNDRHEDGK